MRTVDGHLRWNLSGLYAEVLTGLTVLAARYPGVVSIGIDTWAVDYGLLDAEGQLLAEPIAYRDDRTDAVISDGGRRDQSRAPVRRSAGCSSCRSTRSTSSRRSSRVISGIAHGPRRAAARPAGLLADRRAADGDHQRLHHRPAGRAAPILVGRGVRRPGPSRRSLPTLDRTRGDGRGDHRARSPTGPGCRPPPPWSRSVPTTPPPRWSPCRPPAGTSRTCRRAPGPWSGWSSTSP